ncbi:hypothetical protein [Desulfomonile tiedjei]|uniref:Uncharacterized protein n=1 Tax=Desulfomonile tiedjei (strain ATCC 49306 / DSM 6799 / DCB-1) TaxID=706587 RepID=I4C8D3_DESTA|nr:hypothetical protein [Desulfomonile tiedjei]AFM25824.1 hypothetical protein Desti_3163 [Desulfomonile tiedjei DSM 6799]
MRGGQGLRTVVEEPEVLEAIIKYRKTIYRFDDAYEALVWHLAHHGKGIKGSVRIIDNVIYYMHVQKRNRLAGTPRLSAIYRRVGQEVIITQLYVD